MPLDKLKIKSYLAFYAKYEYHFVHNYFKQIHLLYTLNAQTSQIHAKYKRRSKYLNVKLGE